MHATSTPVETLLRTIAELRRAGGGDHRRSADLHRALAAAVPRSPADLLATHEALLFHAAFPTDRVSHRVVERALGTMATDLRRPAAMTRRRGATAVSPPRSSGVAGATAAGAFSLSLLHWLSARFPGDVVLAWRDASLGSAFDDLLGLLAARPERDGLLTRRFSTQGWIDLARAGGRAGSDRPAGRARVRGTAARSSVPTDCDWLMAQCRRLRADGEVIDALLEHVDMPVRWALTAPGSARTDQRFPPRPLFIGDGTLRRDVDLRAELDRPLPSTRPLPVRAARRLVDTARAVLAVRGRETDPTTHANPAEVTLLRLDRGVDVALFGMVPARRLPVESYFGFMAARNRVPVAYGGGWVFMGRCEIGVNIFDTFRGGESAFIFSQVLRAYRQHFHVRRFVVDPYQFGQDNPEAIRSGAFWFYDRLGFRSRDEGARRLADAERARRATDRTYRSRPAILRRLAKAGLELSLVPSDRVAGGNHAPDRATPDVVRVGLAITELIGRRYRGDRTRAEAAALRLARRVLDIRDLRDLRDMDAWPPGERSAFRELAVLLLAIDDVRSWSGAERRALLRLLRRKGARRERPYALATDRHERLRTALLALERRGDALERERADLA